MAVDDPLLQTGQTTCEYRSDRLLSILVVNGRPKSLVARLLPLSSPLHGARGQSGGKALKFQNSMAKNLRAADNRRGRPPTRRPQPHGAKAALVASSFTDIEDLARGRRHPGGAARVAAPVV